MMNCICLIICYFGKLPNYFDVWLESCKKNNKIDFLIITDQNINIEKSQNVKLLKITLKQLNEICKRKLRLDIDIKKPYKICDFRPAYGIIFEDYLKEYKFWGHCDLDVIFGDVTKFINNDILLKYDRILINGNLSLYKNNKKMNNLFKKNGSIYDYKTVFESECFFAFDEFSGINRIAEKNNIKTYVGNFVADITPKYKKFDLCYEKNYKYQVFYYENNKIMKVYINEDDKICYKEYSHIHFQKRTIDFENFKNMSNFYITSKGIFKKDKEVTKEDIKKYSFYNKKINILYDYIFYNIGKICQFFCINNRQKKIWIKQKIDKLK